MSGARMSTGGNPPRRRNPTDSAPDPTPPVDTTPRPHPGDASTLLHLAPPSLTALTAHNQLKAFIIDYCTANSFPDTAAAFARESRAFERMDQNNRIFGLDSGKGLGRGGREQGREGLDRDGDESMGGDEVTAGKEGNGNTGTESISEEGWPNLSEEDLDSIRLRRDIKEHILAGRILQATDLIKHHYPMLLDDETPPPHPLPPYDPRSFFVPTHSIPPPPISPSTTTRSTASGVGILRPTILSINLNLQAFVELIRTASMAVSAPSTPRPSSPFISTHSTHSHPHAHLLPTADDLPPTTTDAESHDSPMSASTSSLTSITSTRTSAINTAISRAQLLYSQVMSMETIPSTNPSGSTTTTGKGGMIQGEKEAYLRELQGVAAMMAYGELTAAPESVRKYLDLGRREGLADLVIAGILHHEGRSASSLIELAARKTTAIWSALGEWKVSLPAPSPPTSASGNGTKDNKTRAKVLLPAFDLHTFLNIPDPLQIPGSLEVASK